jgi:hypothetical protein
MDIIDYLNRQGGAARATQLKKSGYTRAAVNQAVALGVVVKVRRGVYAVPGPGVLTSALLPAEG